MDAGDLPGGEDTEASIESSSGNLFLQQLTEAHPSCVDAVTDLLQHWQSLGGVPSFGQASEISCFMLLYADRTSSERIWPFTIYPKSGSIEVVFQHMRRRPVFSDPRCVTSSASACRPADVVVRVQSSLPGRHGAHRPRSGLARLSPPLDLRPGTGAGIMLLQTG